MGVMYVSFGYKARPKTFECVAIGSAVLFILKSRLLVYSAGFGLNRVEVVLSGFSVILFCFIQAKTVCRYGCMYFLAALVLVDVMVMYAQFSYRFDYMDPEVLLGHLRIYGTL